MKITTIVLTWNSADYIVECLNSLLNSNKKTDILVIDNDSHDTTREIVKKKFASVGLINSGSNLGYAAGNNLGIRHALKTNPDFIFILNPDATIAPDCIDKLSKRLVSNLELAGVSPIIYRQASNIVWYAGSSINWRSGITPHLGAEERDTGQFKHLYTERLNGCAMLLNVTAIEKVGLMDENYFLYFEETDWSVRFSRRGYKLGFESSAQVWHAPSSSTVNGNIGSVYQYYMARNRMYFMKKFNQQEFKSFIRRHFRESGIDLIKILKHRGPKVFLRIAKARLRGYKDFQSGSFGRQSSVS